MVDVAPERFEELVAEALDSLPPDLAEHMSNVGLFIQDRPTIAGLLGLYEGIPLTDRGEYGALGGHGLPMPDRITLYRLPICGICHTEDDVVDQVRVTVIHEVAHHFGIDDDRLDELGWA